MKKLIVAAAVLMAGTALAQTPPAPPPAAPAPLAAPERDRVTTRAEAVEKVRSHFERLDSNKDGAITKEEATAGHWGRKRFREMHREHAEGGAPQAMTLSRPMGDPNAAFDRLDANKDGAISREEFAKGREQRIERRMVMREKLKERAGTPKDGKQMRRHVMRMHGRGPFGAHMIVMADTDKDGRITQAEAEALALQHFDRLDSNRDGQVTREERRAGRPMMIRHREQQKSGS